MAPITRPVTKTIISTTAFGIPVVDAVNELTNLSQPTWKSLGTIAAGWQQFPGLPAPEYTRAGRLVLLRGVVRPTATIAAGTSIVINNMPADAVPTDNRNMIAPLNGGVANVAIVFASKYMQASVPTGGYTNAHWIDLGQCFYFIS